jgi:2-deoxy-D-gluconate 3-dehydrogenase
LSVLPETRRVLVTGGAGGIGAAISRAFVGVGADVIIMSRSDAARRVAEEIGAGRGSSSDRDPDGSGMTHGRCRAVNADMADEESTAKGVAEALGLLGGLDVLVVCHGDVVVGDALELALDDWRRVIEVNLTATFAVCQMAARQMLRQREATPAGSRVPNGRIITIASMYAFFGGVRVAAYTASKGGVAQLTKALANEWAAHGINVNCIAPGYVRTEMNRHVWQDPVRSSDITARLPAGRWGEPEDIAGPVMFLASEAADYLHGVVLPVDGGFLVR